MSDLDRAVEYMRERARVCRWPRLDKCADALVASEAECERLRRKLKETMPIIAALAVYGENANLSALVAKARELNEAALGEADDE